MTVPPNLRAAVIGVWLVLASGPVLGTVALLRTLPSQDDNPEPPATALGFAELVVAAHRAGELPPLRLSPLHGVDRDQLEARSRDAALRDAAGGAHIAAVDSTPAGADRWGITVLVLDLEADSEVAADDGSRAPLEAWQVTVAMRDSRPVAELAPTLIALPQRPSAGSPLPGRAVPDDDPRAVAIRGFVHAHFVSHRDLDRWMSPTAALAAVPSTEQGDETRTGLPGPADAVSVVALHAQPLADGRQVALAELALSWSGRSQLMHLPLLISDAGSRWEVNRVLPALPHTSPPARR